MTILLLLVVTALVLSSMLQTKAYAHGYVESPPARVIMYFQNDSMIGSAAFDPQSMGKHFNNGWPQAPQSPRDGHLASADCVHGCPQIDRQTSTLWNKTNISTGWNEFVWYYTAWHATAKWEFFITKQGWNQNAPLSRDSFDLVPIYSEAFSGQNPGSFGRTRHQVFIPHDRSGYHVVYAVWTTTPGQNNETFYNVIDLNIGGSGGGTGPGGGGGGGGTNPPIPEIPSGPTNLHTMNVTSNNVNLMWSPANGAVYYNIQRGENQNNMQVIGSTTNTTSYTDQTVQPGRTYFYQISAFNNANQPMTPSNTITVNTPGGGTPPPPGGTTTWDPFAFYNAGDIVLYNGSPYRALITFQGFGDPNWNPISAPSIW